MANVDWARVKILLDEALAVSPEHRAAFLQAACGDDPLLKASVHDLVRAHDRAGDFLNEPTLSVAAPGGATEPAALGEGPGARIGPYKLLQQIGEGGFGVVFMAEQQEPVVRRVALKIIKVGMDTRQVIARFEAERQALAMMDHPNIARVLDAGATATGRPYFVMELVKGVPITGYCDEHSLGVRERIELFGQVCDAVQHAHQKGIIHRDIKPSNVLVTVVDSHPIPKVIDFGIAKATVSRLTEKTLFTEHRALIGTPEYMSPEQADIGAADIDTRSDIYSLGVLLYELLTGVTPLDGPSLRSAAFEEMQRLIREHEPPKPSTRLNTLASLPSVAARRGAEPKRLGSLVRGDLDWIVMKCLDKDRTRRYETASALATDVRRHLAGEPVMAAPPGAGYRLWKFVRRNRGPVAAAAAVLLVLLGGIAGTSAGFLSAHRRAQSEAAAKVEALAAARLAEERREEIRKVADFQARMLSELSPADAGFRLMQDIEARYTAALSAKGMPAPGREAAVAAFRKGLVEVNSTDVALTQIDRTLLRPAVEAIGREYKDQPTVEASLCQALATVHVELGLIEAAVPVQERALEIRRRVLGARDPATLESIGNTGLLRQLQGKPDQAEAYAREAVDGCRAVLGPDHPDTLTAVSNMGMVLQAQGKYAQAEQYLREAMDKRRRVLGEDDRDTLASINNMGFLFASAGRLGEARPLYTEALERRRRVLGPDHRDTLLSMNNLGCLLQNMGLPGEAEPLCREALAKYRHLLGDEHPETLTCASNMVSLLIAQHKFDLAEPYAREVLEGRRHSLGEEHRDTLTAINNVGYLYALWDKPAEAERYYVEALDKRRRILGPEDPDTLVSVNNVARSYMLRGAFADAERLLVPAAAVAEARLPATHPIRRACCNNLGRLYDGWEKAEPGKGYDAKAAEWKAKFDTLRAEHGPGGT